PFNVEELQLRVAAMLRRIDIESEIKEKSTYQIGGYNFDVINYTLVHENFNKNLTKKEAQILSFLCKFMNNVVPRDIILNGVWGQDDYFVGRSLDVFITKLRKYLSEDETIQLVNVHGIGFKLEVKD
ncbi:MAG: response regulator transcription factor, partial [Flavobacteriales bacterium]